VVGWTTVSPMVDDGPVRCREFDGLGPASRNNSQMGSPPDGKEEEKANETARSNR